MFKVTNTAVSFTKVQKQALDQAQALIDELIESPETETNIWTGTRELKNPETKEVTGTQQTANLDMYVDDDSYNKIEKAISFLGNTGMYLRGTFFGRELVVIKARVKGNADGVVTHHIIQFSKQNTSKMKPISELSDKDFKAFDEDAPVMKIDKTVKAENHF